MGVATGYYKMARGWMRNRIFKSEPYTEREAWCWLIEAACWKAHPVNFLGKQVTLLRGQLTYSYATLAKIWQWSIATVRRYLNKLKLGRMISAHAREGQTLITVINYELYQAQPGSLGNEEGSKETGTAEPAHSDESGH